MCDEYDVARDRMPTGSDSASEATVVLVHWTPHEGENVGSSVGYPLTTTAIGDGDDDDQTWYNNYDGSRDAMIVGSDSAGKTAAGIVRWILPKQDAVGDPLPIEVNGGGDGDEGVADNFWMK